MPDPAKPNSTIVIYLSIYYVCIYLSIYLSFSTWLSVRPLSEGGNGAFIKRQHDHTSEKAGAPKWSKTPDLKTHTPLWIRRYLEGGNGARIKRQHDPQLVVYDPRA